MTGRTALRVAEGLSGWNDPDGGEKNGGIQSHMPRSLRRLFVKPVHVTAESARRRVEAFWLEVFRFVRKKHIKTDSMVV